MIRRLLLVLALAAPVLSAQNVAPLAPYAGTRVAVAPVQFFLVDTASWGAPSGLVLRAAFDSLLSEALNERGLSGTWVTPADLLRAARRNVLYAGDPRNLGAFPVRYGTKKVTKFADPFASNLRRIDALHDARYVLVPVELRVTVEKPGVGRLGMRLLLVDARLSAPLWQTDLIGVSAAAYSPALLQKLATQIADLVVAP
mgnify:CR=1 FL=1